MKNDGGKGSAPRPYSVDQKTFSDNWDKIFSKKKQESKSTDKGTVDNKKETK